MRRCAPFVAVWLRLLSRVGNSLRYKWLWHVGESNPEAKVELAAYDIANLSCRVAVPTLTSRSQPGLMNNQ